MDDRRRLRQFYLRFVLALGIFWGTMPLAMLPFIFRGSDDSMFNILSVVLNSLTILPASVLAFWHRRIACVWLTINATMVTCSLTSWTLRTHDYNVGAIIGGVGSVTLAVMVDWMELCRWPSALDRTNGSGVLPSQ
ncbi:MAG TPA: hypothetical protein VII58_09790 [Acidobacteriaceae bacterium]